MNRRNFLLMIPMVSLMKRTGQQNYVPLLVADSPWIKALIKGLEGRKYKPFELSFEECDAIANNHLNA